MDNLVRSLAQTPALEEFMVFCVGAQEFSIDVKSVSEARRFTPAARLPHAPAYVRGVINLRGVILPVIDLGARLGLAPRETDEVPIVIVVALETRLLGLLVDAVCDIVAVPAEAVAPAPAVEDDAIRDLVRSVITIGERVIGIVALEQILPDSEGEAP